MLYINYNGQLIPQSQAPPAVEGSAFRFGKGLFESMLAIDQALQLTPYHFERLQKGMYQSGLALPSFFNEHFFEAQITRTIKANEHPHQRIRFQVDFESKDFSFLIETMPINEDVFSFNKEGWTLGVIDLALKEFNDKGNFKTINIPLYTQGAAIAAQRGWNDVLLRQGEHIVESGGANIFWIKNKILHTPPLSEGCIEGTMRKYLVEKLSSHYAIVERKLTVADLFDATEVFLTNAVRRIKWVGKIEHHVFSNQLAAEIHSKLFR